MTYLELYEQLKVKGYENGSLEAYRTQCFDFPLSKEDSETFDEIVSEALELDRRAVFKAWYGSKQFGWELHLYEAHHQYSRGHLDRAIDYIINSEPPRDTDV